MGNNFQPRAPQEPGKIGLGINDYANRGNEYMLTDRCALYKPRQDVRRDLKMIVSFDRIGFGIG